MPTGSSTTRFLHANFYCNSSFLVCTSSFLSLSVAFFGNGAERVTSQVFQNLTRIVADDDPTSQIGHFRVLPAPVYQNEVKCSVCEMEMIFYYRANKTHFHKKGSPLGLILEVRVFGTRSGLLFDPFNIIIGYYDLVSSEHHYRS